ncbi:MAG: chemotaxis protein CheB [Candidatus Sericytochromatia bacterium]
MKKVIVADDSNVIKKLVTNALSKAHYKVIETAENGFEAYKKTLALKPDAVIMDLRMPLCDGLESIKLIMKNCPTPVVVLTASEEKESYDKALKSGAVAVLNKPKGFDFESIALQIDKELIAFSSSNNKVSSLSMFYPKIDFSFSLDTFEAEILCIGASTGGPNALSKLLKGLGRVNVPVVIVQHITEYYGRELAKWLSSFTEMEVRIPKEPEIIKNGVVYLPDNGSHLIIKKNKTILSTKEKLHAFICPSIDVTFESIVDAYFHKVIGVLLTGMGKDGVKGLEKIYFYNGYTIAQSKDDCVVFGMPKAAIENMVVRNILHIDKIGDHIAKILRKNKND